jgi:hypothetical protein
MKVIKWELLSEQGPLLMLFSRAGIQSHLNHEMAIIWLLDYNICKIDVFE